jgi:hypothetical protein
MTLCKNLTGPGSGVAEIFRVADYGAAAPFPGPLASANAAHLNWSPKQRAHRWVRGGFHLEGAYPMPARRSTNRFHETELARALRAAKKSGTAIDRVEVDPATGRISVIISKPDGDNAKTGNEVENWITKHADKS